MKYLVIESRKPLDLRGEKSENDPVEEAMTQESHERPVRKGIEIKPHKGGRTDRLYARIEPEIKEELIRQLTERGLTLADWITLMVKEGKILKV